MIGALAMIRSSLVDGHITCWLYSADPQLLLNVSQ